MVVYCSHNGCFRSHNGCLYYIVVLDCYHIKNYILFYLL